MHTKLLFSIIDLCDIRRLYCIDCWREKWYHCDDKKIRKNLFVGWDYLFSKMESLENYWYEEYSKFLSFDILSDYFNIYEEFCEGIFKKML